MPLPIIKNSFAVHHFSTAQSYRCNLVRGKQLLLEDTAFCCSDQVTCDISTVLSPSAGCQTAAQSWGFSFEALAKDLSEKMQSGLLKCQWKTKICGGQVAECHSNRNSKIERVWQFPADSMAGTLGGGRRCSASLHLPNKECKKKTLREDTHTVGDLRARCKFNSL